MKRRTVKFNNGDNFETNLEIMTGQNVLNVLVLDLIYDDCVLFWRSSWVYNKKSLRFKF